MIFDLVLGVLGAIIGAVLDGFLAIVPPPPGWLVTGINGCWELIDAAHSMDHWLPIDLGLTVIAAVLAAYAVSVTIAIVRMIVSYFALGGGAS